MKIEVIDCSFRYHTYAKDYEFAIENINVEILPSKVIAIDGPNGAGKSTLLGLVAGLLKPSCGLILADGVDIYSSRSTLTSFRKSVAMVAQFPEDQFFAESVHQELTFGLRKRGYDEETIRQRVVNSLRELDLEGEYLVHRSPFELAGGEKRLVCLAIALALEPKILLLDEPTAGLDFSDSQMVWRMIRNRCYSSEVAVILISHELENLAFLVDHLIIMNKGQIVHQGRPEEIFSQSEILLDIDVEWPQIPALGYALKEHGIYFADKPIYDLQEVADVVRTWLKSN